MQRAQTAHPVLTAPFLHCWLQCSLHQLCIRC